MFRKLLILLFTTVFFLSTESNAQPTTCTTLGQNPETAYPICEGQPYSPPVVPMCGGRPIPAPPCPRAPFTDINPFWYKFTCFTGGTFGFVVDPLAVNDGEDYDWSLFDVTGVPIQNVYTDPNLLVAFNWSAEFQKTGTSNTLGTSLRECDGPGVNTWSSMPTLIAGHNYLLLISHFTNTDEGYTLSIGGGTAVITDPKKPELFSARAICDGTSAMIVLNKRMKCNSLLANGSEFTITPPVANVISAVGIGCSNSFDLDSVRLTFDAQIPPGSYTITIHTGADGNTLLDNCGKMIPDGSTLPMEVYPLIPTPMDSLTKPLCAPDKLRLVFKKGINCSSIAPDGSDFVVTGTSPVTVISADGECDVDGNTRFITIKLSEPIQVKGNFALTLVVGSDGNTLIDECTQATPAGSQLLFSTKDTVNADFTYNIRYGCRRDTVDYFHDGRNEVNSWKWSFDNIRTSTLQNPSILYGTFGLKTAQLIVTNGVCRDTSDIVEIFLDNELKSIFEATAVVCPKEPAHFIDKSIGNGLSWYWEFGNGNTSTLQQPPPQVYPNSSLTRDILVKLVVTNNLGCKDSSYQKVKVAGNCYIAVPNAFTPNGDGLNDELYPINAYKAVGLLFRVYNRFGQLVFETKDWMRRWDGRFKGQGADPGTYVWTLQYTNSDTGKYIEQKGTSILIR